MQLIDSHAHIDFANYDDDREAMLRRALDAGVGALLAIGIGDGPEKMHRAQELAVEFAGRVDVPKIYTSVGMHPSEGEAADAAALRRVAALAADPNCVAIGEIGLDYYHAENPPIEVQQRVFVEQMAIAAAAGLPILIHCRTSDAAAPAAKEKYSGADAWSDLLALIEEHWRPTGLGGVMHCFSGSEAVARRSMDAGFLISFAGNITYPKAQLIRDAAAFVPL
jgi:TatD DNase family protein